VLVIQNNLGVIEKVPEPLRWDRGRGMGSRRTRDREQGAWSCRRVRSQRGFGYSRIRDRVGHRFRPDHSSRTAGRPPRSSAITCAARSMTAAAKLRSIRVRVGCGSSAT